MSITDELREFIETHLYLGATALGGWKEAALIIADRIDAEHEAKVSYWQGASYKDGYDEGFASADDWLAQHEDAMADHGWVKLPVDANGVPFRIGDKVDSDYYEDGTVTGIQYGLAANGAIRELVAVQTNGWDTVTWRDPEEYAHHHEPTVEDVLREFAEKIIDSQIPSIHPTYEEAITEFAAKLRLAEEGE